MPRYFFDVHDGIHVEDDVGRVLSGLTAAKAEAMKIAAEYAVKPRMIGETAGAVIVLVRDPSDAVVANVRLVFSVEDGSLRLRAHR